jgi:dephospho-CoA kinase
MTLKVGITGGIGSGKSVVCEIFSLLGVPVFNSDLEGRNILETNSKVIEAVKEIFGKEVYTDGKPNRKLIASYAFSDKTKLEKLNAIIHPAVNDRFHAWMLGHSEADYIVKEAAVLVESGAYKEMDYLVLVSAPDELKRSRVVKRDKINEEEIRKRSSNQMKEAELTKYAQFVIHNDEAELLIPQVLKLHDFFKNKGTVRNVQNTIENERSDY